MRARTFAPDGSGDIEVTIVKEPAIGRLYIVEDDHDKRFARHQDRLQPLDDEAHKAHKALKK